LKNFSPRIDWRARIAHGYRLIIVAGMHDLAIYQQLSS